MGDHLIKIGEKQEKSKPQKQTQTPPIESIEEAAEREKIQKILSNPEVMLIFLNSFL